MHSHRALQLQPGVHKVHHKFINKQYHFMTSSDRFPALVSSAVKSNFTNWCCQNLSQRALNALTVQASTTELPVISKLAVPNIYNACRKICFRKSLCLWCELFRWKEDQVIGLLLYRTFDFSTYVVNKHLNSKAYNYVMGNFKNLNHITSQTSVF